MIHEIFAQHVWLGPLVWQSTLCLAAGLAGSFLLRRHAARAHQVLLLGLIAAALIPAISQVVRRNQWGLFVAERTVPAPQRLPSAARTDPAIPDRRTAAEPANASAVVERGEAGQAPRAAGFSWTRAIIPTWLAVSLILLLRLAVQFLLGWRLARQSHALDDLQISGMVEAAKSKLGIQAEVAIRSGIHIRSPIIWCWGRRPVLLIPDGPCRDDSRLDWASILCHELAHGKRRDHVSGLFAELMVCLFPWQPLLWWTRQRLTTLSEEACDDWVLACGQRATGYARTLLGLTAQGQAALIPGVVTSRKGVAGRVRRILEDGGGNPRSGWRWTLATVALTGCVSLGLAFAQARPAAEDPKPQDTERRVDAGVALEEEAPVVEDKIHLRLVDSNGRPVPGAKAARHASIREAAVLSSNLQWASAGVSNENGEVVLETEDLFRAEQDHVALYILHEGRRIGAVHEVVRGAANSGRTIVLKPVCRVHGTLQSTGLAALGRPLGWANTYVDFNRHALLSCMFHGPGFDLEFLLPPGEYELRAYGSSMQVREPASVTANTEHQVVSIKVPDGLPELDLGRIELPPTKVSLMIGKPAPELGPIQAWRNGDPVSLRALRGQVVLLCFDGESPDTSRDLPRLVKLHEALGDKGLTIIALYNCESLEQLDRKWAEVYARFGGVTQVPFRVAIDGGAPTYHEGTDTPRAGATYGRYDITGDPTTVLIDQAGNVVGLPNFVYLQEIIAPMLGVRVEESLPNWRQRFNAVYRLEEGKVLQRIAPPFIPERMDFYRAEDSFQAKLIPGGPDQITFTWDGRLKRRSMGFGSVDRLGPVLEGVLKLKSYEFEGPKSLLDLPLPGDWIIRSETPQEVQLQALAELMANEFGRQIRFERRSAEREVLVARGQFRFHPLAALAGGRQATFVHLYAAETDLTAATGGGGTARSLREFVQVLGDRVNMPVLDQTEPSELSAIRYRHHPSSYLRPIRDQQERTERLKTILDNLTAQTELQFEIRKQPVQVWYVTE